MSFARILITGGNGFVGRRLAQALRSRFQDGETIVTSRRGQDGALACDLSDQDAVDALVARVQPDAVIHLAGQASVGSGANAATWRANAVGTLNLGEAVARHAPDCTFLLTSSVEVYGESFNNGEVFEGTLRQPLSPYSRSKVAAEDLLRDVLPATARLLIGRPCNHSGAGQDERFVIPAFAAQVAQIEAGADPVLQVGNLEARRDFLHVDDVVDAYCGLLANCSASSDIVFNIASGQPVPVADVLERLLAMSNVPIKIAIDPMRMRPSDVPETLINSERLQALTGWKPRIGLDEILADVLSAQRTAVNPAINR